MKESGLRKIRRLLNYDGYLRKREEFVAETYEGSAWFWKIFGGAILGMVTLLSITLINTINNTNERARTDLSTSISEIRSDLRNIRTDLDNQKEKLMLIDSQTTREKLSTLEQQLNEIDKTVKDRSEKIASMEAALAALKEKMGEDQSREFIERIVSLEMEIKALKEKSQQVQIDAEAKKTSLRELY